MKAIIDRVEGKLAIRARQRSIIGTFSPDLPFAGDLHDVGRVTEKWNDQFLIGGSILRAQQTTTRSK